MTREEMRYKLNELRMMLNDGEHGEEQGVLVEIISELDRWEEIPIIPISALSKNKGDFDGMTNGEVIQALFPYIEVSTYGLVTCVKGLDCDKGALDPYRHFWSDWWNAPYQKEGE